MRPFAAPFYVTILSGNYWFGRFVISPGDWHHVYLQQYNEHFPNATVYVAPGRIPAQVCPFAVQPQHAAGYTPCMGGVCSRLAGRRRTLRSNLRRLMSRTRSRSWRHT